MQSYPEDLGALMAVEVSHCENFVGIFSTNHDQGNVPTSQNRGNGKKPEHMYFDDKSIRYEKFKIKLT